MLEDSANYVLDTCGLFCPEPVMLLHSKVDDASSGETILVKATDPSTTRDIPKFCKFLGHELVDQKEENDMYIYLVKKG